MDLFHMSMRENWLATQRLVDAMLLGLIISILSISCYPQLLNATEIVDTVPRLGVELSEEDTNSLPRHVFSDGEGLPPGEGTAVRGAELFAQHCASCHGSVGQGGKAIELVGDRSLLTTAYPDKGIGVYWPYAPTLFEYIHRSMPPENPVLFTSDELYSLVAHLLELNGLIDKEQSMDAEMLKLVKMPNRAGFITIAQ